jgi:hypothetical protein
MINPDEQYSCAKTVAKLEGVWNDNSSSGIGVSRTSNSL